jgi:nitroreductase
MEVREAIEKRRSMRNFSSEPVLMDQIREIIQYANMAPSAGNLQDRDFIIVDDPSIKERIAVAAGQGFVSQASIVIVVCANYDRISSYGERGKELFTLQDSAAAVQNMLLMATDMGLGACWVGAFDEREVREILKIPSCARPVAIVPIGHLLGEGMKTNRMEIEKLIHHNEW